MIKVWLLILLTFFTTSTIVILPYKFEKIFADDYKEALQFINQNKSLFRIASIKYGHKLKFSESIIFPELIRYSLIKDIIETEVLELLYSRFGSTISDFSIGYFQMKPSFIESVENEVSNIKKLNDKYHIILFNNSLNDNQKRQSRIERLKNLKWQIIYLHAFIAICDNKWKENSFNDESEKLIIYSTAYNYGFNHPLEKLSQRSRKKAFPYGDKHDGTQYAYSDISCYYFKN